MILQQIALTFKHHKGRLENCWKGHCKRDENAGAFVYLTAVGYTISFRRKRNEKVREREREKWRNRKEKEKSREKRGDQKTE